MEKLRRIRWGITPIALLFFAGMILTDQSGICLAAALAAAVHEMGHLFAALCMKIPLSGVRVDLFGARISVRGQLLSYGQEWLLCASGPISSLLLSAAVAPLWSMSDFFRLLSCASLLLGILNLLPVKSFDGGRMTEVALCRFCGAETAFFVMRAITLTSLFLLWSVSVYFLIRSGGGFSFFCFSLGLLARFLEYGKIS